MTGKEKKNYIFQKSIHIHTYIYIYVIYIIIFCTAPFLLEGVEPPTKFSKDGGCWKREGDFFRGGCNFVTKNKVKSGIFNDKKSL